MNYAIRTGLTFSLLFAVACASSPPPKASGGTKTATKKRPPRRLGFGGTKSAGKAELEEAIAAAKKNDLDTVIAKCRAAIGKNPNLEQAYLLLGSACSLKDDTKCERLAYQDGLEALPTSIAILSELGFLELGQGNAAAAVKHYERANEIAGGKNAEVLAHLAYARGLSGDTKTALKLADDATTMDTKCARCAAIHGRLLLANEQQPEAIVMLERAVALDKTDVDAANQLAKAYFLAGKLDRAGELYKALVDATGDPGMKSEYAVVLMKAKRYDEAAATLTSLSKAFPAEKTLLERLLTAQTKAGDKKGARATKKKLRGLK